MATYDEREWRAIPGFEGIYEVTRCGSGVRSLRRKRPNKHGRLISRPGWDMSVYEDKGGRRFVTLSKDGKPRPWAVYVLVAKAFVENPDPERFNEVNHLDGVPWHDHAENLEWTDRAGNMAHAVENGLCFGGGRGGDSPRARLTSEDVLEMRQLARTDRPAAARLGMSRGVSESAAYAAIRGKTWRHLPLR